MRYHADMNDEQLAIGLKQARRRLNIDQAELGRQLGVSKGTVSRLESGEGGMTKANRRSAVYWLMHIAGSELVAEIQKDQNEQKEQTNQLTDDTPELTVSPVDQASTEVRGHRALNRDEETVSIAVKVPASLAAALKDSAWKARQTTSQRLRAIMVDALMPPSEE